MTTSAYPQLPFNFWGLDLLEPNPRQDTDLLKQFSFVPGLKEFLTVRQVHALEHATLWVLSDTNNSTNPSADNQLLGGMSTEEGFYLYGQVNVTTLRRAVLTALQRLKSGQWNLALHPRCGTNLSVGMALTAGLALGAHLMLPRGPIEQILGLGIAATAAAHLTPDLGKLAQKYLTTAIPYNLAIADITITRPIWGNSAHFVRVRWVD